MLKFAKKSSRPRRGIVCAVMLALMLTAAAPVWAYDVMVGGQSLGIILKSEGAIVVGFTPVKTAAGAEAYPARDAGVELSDRVLAINGRPVSSNQEVADLVNEIAARGEAVQLQLKREERELAVEVEPALCAETGLYRLGLYIRDANAGIGTLTFYDPATANFAALGHKIDEQASYGSVSLGRVLAADVQYVESSRDGEPGEKVGVFDESHLKGTILKNCSLGIYGTMTEPPENALYAQKIEVASADEVKPGPATILTVLEGEQIEEFGIEIERVMPQKRAGDKGMVIKVTDERLLAAAGGIVQGMSGSPIIQDGKLVGAVTHVFVNDGSSGYGCFAEWMLEEALSI